MTMDSDEECTPPESVDDNDNTPNVRRRSAPVDPVFVSQKLPHNGPNDHPT